MDLTNMPELQNVLFDLMVSEAKRKYIIGEHELPAITINNKYLLSPDAKKDEKYTVYFGGNVAHYNAKTLKEAEKIAEGILKTTKKIINVTIFGTNDEVIKFLHIKPKVKGEIEE